MPRVQVIHFDELVKHPSRNLVGEAIAKLFFLHPSQTMLKDISSTERSTFSISHTSMKGYAFHFGVICCAVKYIGIIKYGLTR